MEIILNSKFFAELPPAQLGTKVKSLGHDGLDLCVRLGHPVHPGNVIGYFRFAEGDDDWKTLDRARRDLEKFGFHSEKHGVKCCYYTHCGLCIGSNCAGLMHLIQGFDPAHVGAYPDFGHMALEGEDIAMGLAMLRDHLCVVGIKDGLQANAPGEAPPYQPKFAKLGEGSVQWLDALRVLRDRHFSGPFSVHTEYGMNAGEPALERIACEDAAYLRQLAASQGAD